MYNTVQSSKQRNKKNNTKEIDFFFSTGNKQTSHQHNTKKQLPTTEVRKIIQVLQIDQIANTRRQGSTELVIVQIPINSLFPVNIIQNNHTSNLSFFSIFIYY